MALQKNAKVILTLIGVGCLAVVLFYDFSSERALTKQIHTDYSVHDPDFIRGINQLIGPPLVEAISHRL